MDAARRAICLDDPFNPLITSFTQASGMLVISHFFHLILKPFGQAGPAAQILQRPFLSDLRASTQVVLPSIISNPWGSHEFYRKGLLVLDQYERKDHVNAGLVLGPSLLSRIPAVKKFFIMSLSADYYKIFSLVFSVLFMFLIGLETDIPFMWRNLRKASILAYGGVIICGIFGAAVSVFIIFMLNVSANKFYIANVLVVILAGSASPVVIRLLAELKFATADVGRLAISSALIAEMSCVLWFFFCTSFKSGEAFGKAVIFIAMTVALVLVNKYFVNWCNQRNRNQKYVSNAEVLVILCLVTILAFITEDHSFNGTMSSFFVGLVFPREGKTTRTLLRKLSYAVHTFVLPIYFGFIGFQFNVNYLNNYRNIIVVLVMIFLGLGGKIIGTLAACHHLKIPKDEGILLALILNLKGNTELLFLGSLPRSQNTWWDQDFHSLVVIVIVLDTLISGPAVACILRVKEKYFAHKLTSLELLKPESELRMLACVYGSRHFSQKIGLIWTLSGSLKTPIAAYLMHLVELPKKRKKKKLMYHQLKDGDQFSDEDDYGGNDVVEINEAVDGFNMETRFFIHQIRVVSSFARMYEDVCDSAEDLRVSIIFLTFHKHQRLDGKMENGKEGMRTTNHKVLRHAPCSVGIFVDRGETGFQHPSSESLQNVATLFFGGPDDREALACSSRIADHPHIKLTLIRFIQASPGDRGERIDNTSSCNDEVLMAISDHRMEAELDNASLGDFYNRNVATGKVGYTEKYVNDGRDTVKVLGEMRETFSLFIVGKDGRGHSPMTTDMSDWEECPELGTVGDLLASSELDINGSVLVIQQHQQDRNDLMDD